MNKNDVLFILENVTMNPYFKDFKLRRSDAVIISRQKWGWQRIVPNPYNSYDLSRKELALEIKPCYGVRFNILHKWVEKYSKKELKVQRDKSSIAFIGRQLGVKNEFYFLESREDFDKDIRSFTLELTEIAKQVFSKFKGIEDYYEYCIGDVLRGKRDFPDIAFDWVLERLIATKVVRPSDYNIVKKLVLERVEYLHSRGEPNVELYYDELPAILEDLEQTDFQSGKWG
jgi:hypothetical protein